MSSDAPYEEIISTNLTSEKHDSDRLERHLQRLTFLFDVKANVQCVRRPKSVHVPSAAAFAFTPCETSSLDVKLVAKNVETLEKAKKYMSCCLDDGPCVIRCHPSRATTAELRDRIERDTCAVLTQAENLAVEVRGREECVEAAAAALLLDERTTTEDARNMESQPRRWEDDPATRAKLDSEDSSYDSDYENSDPRASPDNQHDEVSRTVSDTLGAEFSEYVSLQPSGSASEALRRTPEREDDDAVFSDPNYTNRIEFALKLGYTEQQGYIALQKLGPKAEQNELLAELIKLGASSPSGESRSTGGGAAAASGSGNADANSASSKKKEQGSGAASAASSGLRQIVIDGSNVAMSHGNKELFSCHGIKLCVDWFKARGHKDITVFVPLWRKETSRPDMITKDQEILWELEKERLLVFTPSRQMGGRRMACHDDRYILKLAAETDGIVVSNDNYRDFINESPEYKRVVEERLLMYSFVNDRFMPPDDPMGRHGPSLDIFLHKQGKPLEPLAPSCPYGKKCTYGNKCKYYHPERGNQPHKSVSEQLAEQAKIHIQEVKSRECNKLKGTLSSPLPISPPEKGPVKRALQRTKSLVVPALVLPTDSLASGSEAEPSVRHRQQLTVPAGDSGFKASCEYEASPAQWMPQFYEESGTRMSASDQEVGGRKGMPNSHRKLQRQLTLNPNYDPRLVHMRALQQKLHPPVSRGEMETEQQGAPSKERLVRHSSAGAAEIRHANVHGSPWCNESNLHQNVTRIASAPDSYHQWHHRPCHPANAASDPQLHRYGAPPAGSPYVWSPSVQNQSQPIPWRQPQAMAVAAAHEEQRHHLYYHLASVFPAEQVQAAMEMNLEETNPQAICAAILAMFPKPE